MKRTVLLFTAILFFMASLVYLNVTIFSEKPDPDALTAIEEDTTKASLRDPMADTDGDGLKNWEEDLYGTGKKSSDSDGDGITDGQEVANGTDPRSFLPTQDNTTVVSEQVVSYEFQQLDNPQSIESLVQSLTNIQNQETNTDEVSLVETNAVILDNKQEYTPETARKCVNELAIVIDNSLVTSLQDMAVLQNYLIGSTTNTYAIEQLLQANKIASGKLASFDTTNCSFMNKQTTQLRRVYEQFVVTLEQALGQGTPGSENYDYEIWLEYSNGASDWITVMNDTKVMVSALGISFSASEPGVIFTQVPSQL